MFLKNVQMELTDFMHVDTDLQKLKADQNFLGGHGQKRVWPVWSRESKIDCISKMNRSKKLNFRMLIQIQESKKLIQ